MKEYHYFSQIRALQLKQEIETELDEINTRFQDLVEKYPFFYVEIRIDPERADAYFNQQCSYTTNIKYNKNG